MKLLDVRRGMARFGFVVLVLWEALVILGSVQSVENVWNTTMIFLFSGIVIPAAVWMCWRAVLWIVSGFVRDVPAP